jgi:hypothetical protein
MRANFCHFIHLQEFQGNPFSDLLTYPHNNLSTNPPIGVEIPREHFFKARNFYIAKRMELKQEMMNREASGTLTPELA